MSALIGDFVMSAWQLMQLAAPYLLLGFIFAGVLNTVVPRSWIEGNLKGSGLKPILKSIVVGIPLPICSCGVIPVAAGLRSRGASKGVTAAFVTATPQTGLDSILATYGMLGGLFTTIRLFVSFVSSLLVGLAVGYSGRKNTQLAEAEAAASQTSSCCGSKVSLEACAHKSDKDGCLICSLHESFVMIPGKIGKHLIFGILLGAAITTFLDLGKVSVPQNQFLMFGLITLIATPLYICATGSIPFAFAMIQSGFSMGAALLLLIVGPATNSITIATLFKIIGKKETLVYLIILIVTGWISAFLLDVFWPSASTLLMPELDSHSTGNFHTVSAILLVLLVANGMRVCSKGSCAESSEQANSE